MKGYRKASETDQVLMQFRKENVPVVLQSENRIEIHSVKKDRATVIMDFGDLESVNNMMIHLTKIRGILLEELLNRR